MKALPNTCAQTLHGYARGHRLLAKSGDLSDSELHELDRLSDLSGYLPADARYDAYHTGFPCGRYYALACTWPDDDAPRRGTVLTHTLLIPREQWRIEPDPFRWLAVHRRPSDAHDLAPYQIQVPEPDSSAVSPSKLHAGEMRALLWLWFGQAARPILWVEDPPPLRVVRCLWPWLWSESREAFAFCTFALQPRNLRGRPFDFLGVPAPAVGAFHELGGSPAWWRAGRLHVAMNQEPWIDALMESGPDAVAFQIARLRDQGLGPPPSTSQLRGAQRYLELEAGANLRLPAARARLDMLNRIWPDLEEDHPAVVDAIEKLLAHQPAAPLEPQPLWDLNYLLAARAVKRHVISGSLLGKRILTCVQEQVESRLRRVNNALGPLIGEELAALYVGAPAQVRGVILEAIAVAASASAGERMVEWAESLLDLAVRIQDISLEHALWRSIPIIQLVHWLEPQRVPLHDSLRERVATLAVERQSPELALAVWSSDLRRGLNAAAAVVQEHPTKRADFETLLQRQDTADQLEWCLDCNIIVLREIAIRLGAELIKLTKANVMQLAARCDGRPLGPEIFLRVCAWAPDSELSAVFAHYPSLARDVLRYALSEPSSSAIVESALRAIPAPLLWDRAPLLPVLAAHEMRPPERTLRLLVHRLLGDLVAGHIVPEDASEWLKTSAIESWLSDARIWDVEQPLFPLPLGGLRRVITAVGSAKSPPLGLARPLLVILARVRPDVVRSEAGALLDLVVRVDPEEPVGVMIRAELLGALRYASFNQAWRLVEACFSPVYYAAGTNREVFDRISWWRSCSPDRQRFWRRWLLDAWILNGWPLDAFVRCLGGDATLAARIFKRARKLSWTSRAWVAKLEPAVRNEPALYQAWYEVVN